MAINVQSSIAVLLACCASACAEPPSFEDAALHSEEHDPDRDLRGKRTGYDHPLLDAPVLADGRVAIVDTVDAPTPNRRYAELHTFAIAEDGTETRSSGVVELRREFRAAKPATRRSAPAPSPTVGQPLREQVDRLIAEGRGQEPVAVDIVLRRPSKSLTGELRRHIARGAIQSVDDLHVQAEQIKLARAVEVRTKVGAVADAIVSLGGTPGYRCQNGYCLHASLPATLVDRVAALADVQRISQAQALEPESGGGDAEDRSEIVQINQFLDDGYDGEQDPSTRTDDIWFAVIENDDYDDEHPGWDKDDQVPPFSRVGSGHTCTNGMGCVTTGNFATPNPANWWERHPTQVSALIFANFMEGQGNPAAPERHSGFARNAIGRLFLATTSSAWDEAFDVITDPLGPYEHVVNMSQGVDGDCNGDDPASSAANQLYEDGTLLIKSAGNDSFDPNDPDVCTVTEPGAAIGVFTVAGLNSSLGTLTAQRSAGIWWSSNTSGSSVGGSESTPADGQGRTIVDLAAHSNVAYVPRPVSEYSSASSGTSFAAPQVTGAAINFIDYFQDVHFNLEYEPGYLFTNLLLMGDRVACSDLAGACTETELSTRFDRRFGAGRARFRRFDGPGMDSPYYYGTGMIPCLGDSEIVDLEVPTDNSFVQTSSGVNDFKFVAWWYDRRHEINGTVANVDLRLYHVDSGGNELGTLLTSNDAYDNKERLYYNAPGSKRLVVEFEGTDTVPTDDSWTESGCSDGEVNVYFAYFAEDDDRNDFDGPSWSSPNGVEPEDVVW
jgi:hypothetical protein